MKYFTAIFLLLTTSQANAVNFLLEAGYHDGGDVVVTGVFTTGYEKDLLAGEGISLAAGVVFDHGSFTSRFKYGNKKADVEGLNGTLTFKRNTADALLLYKVNKSVQIGGGITYHSNIKLEISGNTASPFKFDNAIGFVAEADLFWDPKSYIGIFVTVIDYEYKGTIFNGNSVGFVLGGVF